MEETEESRPLSREERTSALFANMVIQQTNLAMMFLGKVPHPETKEHVRDLEMAQMFIDQLEMIETKTKNNLSKQEDALLRQSLTAVRMAFVEAANESEPSGAKESAPASGATTVQAGADGSAEPEDTRKKFTKKY